MSSPHQIPVDGPTSETPAASLRGDATRLSLNYDRVRIGGRSGVSFFRCIRCRALLEERFTEQEQHENWHRDRGEVTDASFNEADANNGW